MKWRTKTVVQLPKSPITAFALRSIHLFVVPITLHTPMHARPCVRDRSVVEMEKNTVDFKSKMTKHLQEITCESECPCAHSNRMPKKALKRPNTYKHWKEGPRSTAPSNNNHVLLLFGRGLVGALVISKWSFNQNWHRLLDNPVDRGSWEHNCYFKVPFCEATYITTVSTSTVIL